MDGRALLCLTTDGELTTLTDDAARQLVREEMPIVCHAPTLARRLLIEKFPAYDVLELFAFIHPGKFTVPTPRGLARALSLMEPLNPEDQCLSLRDSVLHLLVDLTAPGREEKTSPAAIAAMMGLRHVANDDGRGWPWAPVILAALDRDKNPPARGEIKAALRIFDRLPEWAIHAPEPPPGHHGVEAAETEERLKNLLSRQKKEDRPQQRDYALHLSHAFAPVERAEETNVVLAEAGTGVGKTLGYLAPATVWAEKNGGPVWVSTYTRNLQRQVEAELDKFYDDPVTKARKVVTRKGRENYLCLLNLEDAAEEASSPLAHEQNTIALGLMLRWAGVTEDGDLAGKDFPGWLPGLVGWHRVHNLADRRGECIYSACPHFDKCFIEKSVRKARRADIVIANHALVMHQAAVDGPQSELPQRFVFDEGHHLFDAADGVFSAQLGGMTAADLRRWLLGAETQGKSRARGIKRRLEDLIPDSDGAMKDIEALQEAALCLPGPGWRQRVIDEKPKGTVENFLTLCRRQVYARNKEQESPYSLETALHPAIDGLFEAAYAVSLRLNDLKRPMLSLIQHLKGRLDDEADELDTATRERIHYMISSLRRRAENEIGGWIAMLDALKDGEKEGFVDWLEVARLDGKDMDVSFCRHTLDPAKIFAARLQTRAHGAVITSATLRDPAPDDAAGWKSPLIRSGAETLAGTGTSRTAHVASPFDYAAQTRIIVVGDVRKENTDEVAGAYRELFKAAGGGALGLFTAVQRLKAVQEKLVEPLEKTGLPLYAQHVDALDTGTLIDIFREEENACLLGTDATRDGIDVPGRSLRLVVYDRVPWPRPDILHKARRAHFGKGYDDMLTRFRLKQAYGRLIRRADDKGVFVMLDSRLPTRLTTAFPDGVEIQRVGLAEAVKMTKEFLG